jgi:hypothetical protein
MRSMAFFNESRRSENGLKKQNMEKRKDSRQASGGVYDTVIAVLDIVSLGQYNGAWGLRM